MRTPPCGRERALGARLAVRKRPETGVYSHELTNQSFSSGLPAGLGISVVLEGICTCDGLW